MADADFSPTFLRASTAYGVVAPAPLRPGGQQPDRLGLHHRPVHLKSDGTPWRPLVHVEDIAAPTSPPWRPPGSWSTTRPSTSAPRTENYQIRELAEIVRDVVPGCRIDFAPGAGPDTRCYRVDCNLHRPAPCTASSPSGRRAAASSSCYEAYQRVGLTLEDFEGPRFKRIAHVQAAGGRRAAGRATCAGPAPVLKRPACAPRPKETDLGANPTLPLLRSRPSWNRVLDLGPTPLADRLLSSRPAGASRSRAFRWRWSSAPNCSLMQILETVAPEVLFCRGLPVLLLLL